MVFVQVITLSILLSIFALVALAPSANRKNKIIKWVLVGIGLHLTFLLGLEFFIH